MVQNKIVKTLGAIVLAGSLAGCAGKQIAKQDATDVTNTNSALAVYQPTPTAQATETPSYPSIDLMIHDIARYVEQKGDKAFVNDRGHNSRLYWESEFTKTFESNPSVMVFRGIYRMSIGDLEVLYEDGTKNQKRERSTGHIPISALTIIAPDGTRFFDKVYLKSKEQWTFEQNLKNLDLHTKSFLKNAFGVLDSVNELDGRTVDLKPYMPRYKATVEQIWKTVQSEVKPRASSTKNYSG